MALRTYGDKPLSFQLEENGEYYYVGSEVRTFVVQMGAIRLLLNMCCFLGRKLFAAIPRIFIQEVPWNGSTNTFK